MKVIGIVGQSYTGSSVVNHLLNAATGVYGGSELRRLRDGSGGAKCGICGPGCRVWTPEAIAAVAKAGDGDFYRDIGQVVGAERIVDSSKLMSHFTKDLIRESRKNGVEFCFFAITRHPFAQVCSFLFNNHVRRTHGIDSFVDARAFLADQGDAAGAFAVETLASIEPFIGRFHAAHDRMDIPRFHFRLEDIVDDPARLYGVAADFFGIGANEFTRNDWTDCEAHPIGGNRGPLSQMSAYKGKINGRLSFYQKQKDLFQDEKWRFFMSRTLANRIVGDVSYRRICDNLGYDPEVDFSELGEAPTDMSSAS